MATYTHSLSAYVDARVREIALSGHDGYSVSSIGAEIGGEHQVYSPDGRIVGTFDRLDYAVAAAAVHAGAGTLSQPKQPTQAYAGSFPAVGTLDRDGPGSRKEVR